MPTRISRRARLRPLRKAPASRGREDWRPTAAAGRAIASRTVEFVLCALEASKKICRACMRGVRTFLFMGICRWFAGSWSWCASDRCPRSPGRVRIRAAPDCRRTRCHRDARLPNISELTAWQYTGATLRRPFKTIEGARNATDHERINARPCSDCARSNGRVRELWPRGLRRD
jgi:hypothetical protein